MISLEQENLNEPEENIEIVNEDENQKNQENNEDIEKNEEIENEENDLNEKIKTLEHELAASRADFYNYRQRMMKERQELRKHAQEDVIISILPVLDNLDRALEAAGAEDTKSIITGVEMVRRQFLSVLENLGVSVIAAEGEDFSPSFHDAVGSEKVDDPEKDGKIISERLKGYKTKDRVLRAAQVIVGKK